MTVTQKILIVDDAATDRTLIEAILEDYDILTAADGLEALELLEAHPDIDVMILDLNMPRMNGFEVLQELKRRPHLTDLSTLILTNYDEMQKEIRGLELGALDYIRKPLNLTSLKKRIEIHSNLRTVSRSLHEHNALLESRVKERTAELQLTRDITLNALINLLEVRDLESSNHTKRTQLIIQALCFHLKGDPSFKSHLSDAYCREIVETAPLHDIGKVGIPDSILLKPGRLTPEEFEHMKLHTTYGVQALEKSTPGVMTPGYIRTAIDIIQNHHERFNGKGYPRGLSGEDIPLPGRLMAIVDVYDALISKRVYKEAYAHDRAMALIREESGEHFDPRIVEAFFAIEDEIKAITSAYGQD